MNDLTLELDQTTVLIGENNTGKTSILEALHISMSRGLGRKNSPFANFDCFLTEEAPSPDLAPPIVLTLTFEESTVDEWVEEIDQIFEKAIQLLPDDRKQVRFRITCAYDPVIEDLAVDWTFLDQEGNPLIQARNPKLVSDLQLLAPVFLLGAVRDASQHFNARSTFWGPFTKNPQIDDEAKRQIEEQIEGINQSVLDNHRPFEIVKDSLSKAKGLVSLSDGDLVSMEAVPARIFDMLAKTQVKIASRSGCRLPISQHGAGTQSLSVLFLFEAFLQSRLAQSYDENSVPILALEEPETHLHPSAIRALWSSIAELAGQKIVATHSGDLLAAVPLTSIRRLARRDGQVKAFRVEPATLSADEANKVAYHVRAKRGALLFARCWLLVEGETEFTVLPEVARLMGCDFELASISCVEFAQCGLRPLIKTAIDLGIEWHVLADGDPAGITYASTAREFLGGDPEADRISSLADADMEHCMWNAGFSAVYEGVIKPPIRAAMVTAAPGDPLYTTQALKAAVRSSSKPELAYAVVQQIAHRGEASIPTQIRDLITKAATLSSRSA